MIKQRYFVLALQAVSLLKIAVRVMNLMWGSLWKIGKFQFIKKYLQVLATKVYKAIRCNTAKYMYYNLIFKDTSFELRGWPLFRLPRAHSTYFGTNSIHRKAWLVWKIFLIKNCESVPDFCMKLTDWLIDWLNNPPTDWSINRLTN